MADDRKTRDVQEDDYVRLPEPIWIVLVPMGMALVTAAAFAPETIPYNYLGPIGTLTKIFVARPLLVKGIAISAWILHVGEAFYAYSLSRSKNLSPSSARKWAALVFIYGVFSMRHLLAYKGRSKTR